MVGQKGGRQAAAIHKNLGDKDLSGQIIDEHADALSPEQVRTAQERGVVRDVWATVDETLAEYETVAALEDEDGASPCQT